MTMNPKNPVGRRSFLAAVATAGAAATAGADVFDVRRFGVRGGRDVLATARLQAALDACSKAGGGTVYVPPGEYLSGGLSLPSRVSLYLEAGSTIYASTKPEDYQPGGPHLITARGSEYVSILGPGVLHGQGTEDLGRRPGHAYEPRPKFRTGVLMFDQCRHVILRDFTILFSDAWTIHLRTCEKVVVDGVTILNNYFRTNSDGIDPDSCRDVRISNCTIVAGDDAICLKTHGGIPCEDVVVTNCTTESIATAIKLGTGSDGDFRNITISNCTVRNSTLGVGFYIKDGGAIDSVVVSNLAIETLRDPSLVNAERLRNMSYPLFIDVEKRRENSRIGAVRNVIFSNIEIRSNNGILMQGMRRSLLENLVLHNISLQVTQAFDYSHRAKAAGGNSNPHDSRITFYARKPSYCTLANLRNLLVDNLQVESAPDIFEAYPRSALSVFNAEGAVLKSIERRPGGDYGPVVDLHNVRPALVTGCLAGRGTGTFLQTNGMAEDDVALEASNLRLAKKAIERRDESE
ncbi:MAG TPA: glycosyl hydrolase family 28 protein [Terriglobia bacterium]|nr:glycosyl hydrolase family 28 protein [Terriglobia bacterium]